MIKQELVPLSSQSAHQCKLFASSVCSYLWLGRSPRYRHFSDDLGPFHGFRLHQKPAAYQPEPRTHPDQADPWRWISIISRKAFTGIRDAKLDAQLIHTQFDLGALGLAMFDDVSESFLGHSKEAQGHVFRNVETRRCVDKLNVNIVFLRDLCAKSINCRLQPHMLQLAGMELVRKAVQVRSQLASVVPHLQHTGSLRRSRQL